MSGSDRIDDLIVLGRAAPEPLSDGRHTVCLGGYSDTLGYVRLYPTRRGMTQCRRWNVISVPVQSAAPDDTREESYKIAGSADSRQQAIEEVEKVGRLTKSEQIQLIDRLSGDCTGRLNDERKSLGIVKPAHIHDFYLEETPESTVQVTLDGVERKGKRDYPYKLYIEYQCENCSLSSSGHRQHSIEWGIYQYWDKYDDPENVFDALHLTDEDYQHYFFVGNMNHRRTTYIIISDLRFSESDMLDAGVGVEGQASFADF